MLSGCSQRIVYIERTVPNTLLTTIPMPTTTLITNEDLLYYSIDLKAALNECNNQLLSIAEWVYDSKNNN